MASSNRLIGNLDEHEIIRQIKRLAKDKRHDSCSCSLAGEILTLLEANGK